MPETRQGLTMSLDDVGRKIDALIGDPNRIRNSFTLDDILDRTMLTEADWERAWRGFLTYPSHSIYSPGDGKVWIVRHKEYWTRHRRGMPIPAGAVERGALQTYTLTEDQLLDHWVQFREVFKDQLKECYRHSTQQVWAAKKHTARTHHYGGSLLPRVADRLKMDLAYEWRGVDWVMFPMIKLETRRGPRWMPSSPGPLICLESENNSEPKKVATEISKLCTAASPLRILIIWDDDWNGNRKRFMQDYKETAQRQRSGAGTFRLIVGSSFPTSSGVSFSSYSLALDCPQADWTGDHPLLSELDFSPKQYT